MSSVVIAFDGRRLQQRPWQNHELAELYRAVDMLGRAGLAVETDMGMSDEGDPWFAFCRPDTGDVLVHCARIGGLFVASSVAIAQTFRGANFRDVIDSIVRYQPLSIPMAESGSRLLLHPAAVLTAFIATALLFSHRADAAESHHAVPLAMPAAADHGHLKGFAAIKAAVADLFNALTGHGDNKNAAPQTEPEAPISLAALMSAAMTMVTASLKSEAADNSVTDAGLVIAAWHGDDASHLTPFSPLLSGSQDTTPIQAGDPASDTIAAGAAWGAAHLPTPQSIAGMVMFQIATDAAATAGGDTLLVLGVPDHARSGGGGGLQLDHLIIHPVREQATAADLATVTTPQAVDPTHADSVDLGNIQPDALSVLLGASASQMQADVVVFHLKGPIGQSDTATGTHGAAAAPAGGDNAGPIPILVNLPPPGDDLNLTPVVGDDTGPAAAAVPPPHIILTGNPTSGLADLVGYALSGTHPITGLLSPAQDLTVGLAVYAAEWAQPMRLVVFDSNDIKLPFFQFVQGVVFVNDHELGITPSQAALASAVEVDLATGGMMKLLGVVDLAHMAQAGL